MNQPNTILDRAFGSLVPFGSMTAPPAYVIQASITCLRMRRFMYMPWLFSPSSFHHASSVHPSLRWNLGTTSSELSSIAWFCPNHPNSRLNSIRTPTLTSPSLALTGSGHEPFFPAKTKSVLFFQLSTPSAVNRRRPLTGTGRR